MVKNDHLDAVKRLARSVVGGDVEIVSLDATDALLFAYSVAAVVEWAIETDDSIWPTNEDAKKFGPLPQMKSTNYLTDRAFVAMNSILRSKGVVGRGQSTGALLVLHGYSKSFIDVTDKRFKEAHPGELEKEIEDRQFMPDYGMMHIITAMAMEKIDKVEMETLHTNLHVMFVHSSEIASIQRNMGLLDILKKAKAEFDKTVH